MQIAILVVKCMIALGIGLFLSSLLRQDMRRKALEQYRVIKDGRAKKVEMDPEKKFANDQLEEEMLSTGIKYRMGANFSPFDYMVFRLVVSTLVGILAMFVKYWFFPIGFVVALLVVPYYFKQENDNDNEKMLPDIATMNGLVALQVKNGVYISKVVYECYRTVKNDRLKQALLELSVDIENFATIKDAAVRFRKKFKNPYIDSFAKTLEQVQDSGQSIGFFEDIQASVEGINDAVAIRQEAASERVASIFQILLFLGPVIIVFYIMLNMMNGGGGIF